PPGSYSTSYTATSWFAVLGTTIFNSGGCEITPFCSWLPVEAVANRNANPATAKAPAFGNEFMAPLLLGPRMRQTSSADDMARTRRDREKALLIPFPKYWAQARLICDRIRGCLAAVAHSPLWH